MQLLRTNTATRITVGPFFDKTDGVTPEVAITVTAEKLTFIVDTGGVPTLILDTAPTASGGANDMVHITGDDAGYYDLELAAADVNYLGRAKLALTDATVHCPVFHEYMIIPAMVYDALVLGTDTLQADVTQLLGTAWLAPAVAGTPDVNTKQVGGTAQTAGDLAALITAVDDLVDTEVAAIKSDTAAILIDTAEIGAAGAGLTAVPWNASWDAEVQSECDDALVARDLDHLINNGTAVPAVTAGTFIDQMMDDGTAVYDRTTDSLQAIRDHATTVKTDTAAILVDTAEIGAAGAGLTAIAVGVGGIQATAFAAGAINAAALAADATTELTAGIRIKKNTALSNFPFLMVDSTDHITPKTGLTITATRSIDGAAFAACANAATEVANGFYKISLANTDLNGDTIALKFTGGATADDRLLTIITTV